MFLRLRFVLCLNGEDLCLFHIYGGGHLNKFYIIQGMANNDNAWYTLHCCAIEYYNMLLSRSHPQIQESAAMRQLYRAAADIKTGSCELAPPACHQATVELSSLHLRSSQNTQQRKVQNVCSRAGTLDRHLEMHPGEKSKQFL